MIARTCRYRTGCDWNRMIRDRNDVCLSFANTLPLYSIAAIPYGDCVCCVPSPSDCNGVSATGRCALQFCSVFAPVHKRFLNLNS
jgi:hypothetical protein